MSSNNLLLILYPPHVRPRDVDQFYQIWRSDAARYRALAAGPPVVHPLPPDVPAKKAKRTASSAFEDGEDARSDQGHGRALKRRTSSGWDLGETAVRGLVHTAANVYRSLLPSSWSQSQDTDVGKSYSDDFSTSGSDTNTPTWDYQTATRRAVLSASDTQGPPEDQKIVYPHPAPRLHSLPQDVVDLSESPPSVAQAPQAFFFPDGALPADTDLERMNAILSLLSANSTPPPPFEMDPAILNEFLYAARMRLWPPDSNEHDDLLPWTFLDYSLVIDTCEVLLCFLAHDFSKLDIRAGPGEIEEASVIGFNESQDSTSFEYRHVLPEAPLERVQGKAHIVSSDGAELLLRRWPDAVKVPFVPHTWKWSESDEQSDEERMMLPRILAYAVDSKTAAWPFDGRLGLTVPGYKGPWEEECLGVEVCDQVTFCDALCHNTPREESHLEFTIRLLLPLPRYEALARDNVRSFIYFGKGTPCVAHHDGNEYHPVFGPPIPVVPNTRVRGRYDLWTLRLLAITLLVPPSDTLSAWTPIRIDMPNKGVRAILDTASMNSTLPPAAIKAMCDHWFKRADDIQQDETVSHADLEKLSHHDLVFTFEGTDGDPVEFRCDAAYFLGRLWEDRPVQVPFRWSHVRSSNDGGSDIAVLGMNFFWGAFVKFSAPYHGSDAVPSVQFAAQRGMVGDQKIHGPWDFVFAQ